MSAPREPCWILDCTSEGKYVKPEALRAHWFLISSPTSFIGERVQSACELSVIAGSSFLTGSALAGVTISQHLEQGECLVLDELWASCLPLTPPWLWCKSVMNMATLGDDICLGQMSALISLPLLSCLPRGIIPVAKYKLCHLKINTLFGQHFYFSLRCHYQSFY